MTAPVTAAAAALHTAARDRTPIDNTTISQLSLAEAYQTQHAVVAHRVTEGDRVIGVKLGFTSREKMDQMGVHSPIVGQLTAQLQIDDGGSVSLDGLIHPRIEPELAFLLDDDLDSEAPIAGQLGQIGAVAPAMEIIDSRFAGFSFNLSSVIADNTSAAGFTVGPWTRFTPGMALDNLAVELIVGDRPAATGSTAAIMGDPMRVLPLLLQVARDHGHPLTAGSIILAGAATAAVPLLPGLAEVSVAQLGRASFTVQEGTS